MIDLDLRRPGAYLRARARAGTLSPGIAAACLNKGWFSRAVLAPNLRAVIVCDHDGAKPGARFCGACGDPLASAPPIASPEPKKDTMFRFTPGAAAPPPAPPPVLPRAPSHGTIRGGTSPSVPAADASAEHVIAWAKGQPAFANMRRTMDAKYTDEQIARALATTVRTSGWNE